MATKVDIDQTSITAGQQKQFWELATTLGTHVNRTTFQAYIEGRNPFEKQTRIEFTVRGTGLTAAAWISTLESAGHEIVDWARRVLSHPDYDAKHRLEAGKEYKLVLILGKEIANDLNRTTKNLTAIADKEFGEQSVSGLKAELALLIRMKFSNSELLQMGLYYIAVLHDPIATIFEGDPCPYVISIDRSLGKSWVSADCVKPNRDWPGDGAFAFLAS